MVPVLARSLAVLAVLVDFTVYCLFFMSVYLHSLDGVGGVVSLLDEISVLHVLCESL